MEFKKLKSIKPGYLLVKPIIVTQTASGLFVKAENDTRTNKGEVLLVGSAIQSGGSVIEPICAVGDVVGFVGDIPGTPIKVAGESCFLVPWDEIIGVLDETA